MTDSIPMPSMVKSKDTAVVIGRMSSKCPGRAADDEEKHTGAAGTGLRRRRWPVNRAPGGRRGADDRTLAEARRRLDAVRTRLTQFGTKHTVTSKFGLV
eukprot:scaffold66381_cov63-Phaeocystis_antarctica.AAC.14